MAIYLQESTYSLTEYESQIAHNIARILAEEQITLNRESGSNSDGIKTELEKVITYLYAKIRQTDSESKNNVLANLFNYLDHLIKHGKQIGHTGNVPKYYDSILYVCKKYFDIKQDDATRVLTILGWSARLIRFYKQKKEPKQAKNLKEKLIVKVKVTAVKEDGSIKHVKYHSS